MSRSWASGLGGSRPVNNGFVVIGLKPRDQRKSSADQVIARLRPKLAQVKGAALFLQAAQDLNVGGRPTAPSINTRCRTRSRRAERVGRRESWLKCRSCPCCGMSRPISRPTGRCSR